MKKNKLSFLLSALPMAALLMTFSFTNPAGSVKVFTAAKPTACNPPVFCPSGLCVYPCDNDGWSMPNASIVIHPSTPTVVNFTMNIYYGPTPPWTSVNLIGNMTAPGRPSTTRIFSVSSGGSTFQITVNPSGNFYFQLIGGTTPPGPATTLTGSYNL